MFGKVKQWLGIEGIKLEIILSDDINLLSGQLDGTIRLYSQNAQTVNFIKIKIIEKFSRGRRSEKRIDEYELGSKTLNKSFEVPAEEPVEIDFSLKYEMAKSDMDILEEKNILFRQLVKTAKFIRGVESEFRIEAEADVKGTALNPLIKK